MTIHRCGRNHPPMRPRTAVVVSTALGPSPGAEVTVSQRAPRAAVSVHPTNRVAASRSEENRTAGARPCNVLSRKPAACERVSQVASSQPYRLARPIAQKNELAARRRCDGLHDCQPPPRGALGPWLNRSPRDFDSDGQHVRDPESIKKPPAPSLTSTPRVGTRRARVGPILTSDRGTP